MATKRTPPNEAAAAQPNEEPGAPADRSCLSPIERWAIKLHQERRAAEAYAASITSPASAAPETSTTPKEAAAAPSQVRPGALVETYKPSARESAAIERGQRRVAEAAPAPRVRVQRKPEGETLAIAHEHRGVGYRLLAEALGTSDADFVNGVLGQLGGLARRNGQIDEAELNFLISVVKDAKPRDQFEAMLAAQMAVVHKLAMAVPQRLRDVAFAPQPDGVLNDFIKLTRTYAVQLEALKRYRTGGEQKVTVQHVTVSDGAQAIVGNVTTRSDTATGPAGAARSIHSAAAPMPVLDARTPAPAKRRGRRKNGR